MPVMLGWQTGHTVLVVMVVIILIVLTVLMSTRRPGPALPGEQAAPEPAEDTVPEESEVEDAE